MRKSAKKLLSAAAALPIAVGVAAVTPAYAGCNPCKGATKAKACNPCAAKKACNPCAAKKACNPCNPCAAKKACNPCKPK